MRIFIKIFLFAAVLGGIVLFAVMAVTGENALSSIYTYLIFVILIATFAKMRIFKHKLRNRKDKNSHFTALPLIYFTAGFFGPYAILFYYFSRAVSNISLF